MVHVNEANYPASLPIGAYHDDTNANTIYRIPNSPSTFLFITILTGGNTWSASSDGTMFPDPVTENMQTRAVMYQAQAAQARANAEIQNLQNALSTLQPRAAPPAPRPRLHARQPDAFSGNPGKDKTEAAPRDFTRTFEAYVNAEIALSGPITDENKIILFVAYLKGDALRWIQQLDDARTAWDDRHTVNPANVPVYNGPLSSYYDLATAFLKEFEDVDIRATARHKLITIHMGEGPDDMAEKYIWDFKELARQSGYNDLALISHFSRSIPQCLQTKVQNLGRHCPTILAGWYDEAVVFDRQYREDQSEKKHFRGPASVQRPPQGNRTNQSTRPPPAFSPSPTTFWCPSVPTQTPRPTDPNTMEIDNTQTPRICHRCGMSGHIARRCRTSQADIQAKYGRDRYMPRPAYSGPSQQVRGNTFASPQEWIQSLSAEERASMLGALQGSDPTQDTQSGFGDGSA